MQSFINWGGLTPEQAKQLQFQREVEEYLRLKGISEARTQSSTAAAAVAANGGKSSGRPVLPFNETMLFVYPDVDDNHFKAFAVDFINSRMSDELITDLSADEWSYVDSYLVSKAGYTMLFRNNSTNVYRILFVDKFAQLIDTKDIGPTTDLSYGTADGRFFWTYDIDDKKILLFDGETVADYSDLLDETVTNIRFGTNSSMTSAVGVAVTITKLESENTYEKTLYILDCTEARRIIGNIFNSELAFIEIEPFVGPFSNHIVIAYLNTTNNGYLTRIRVYDHAGNLVDGYAYDDECGYYEIQFYGLSGSFYVRAVDAYNHIFLLVDDSIQPGGDLLIRHQFSVSDFSTVQTYFDYANPSTFSGQQVSDTFVVVAFSETSSTAGFSELTALTVLTKFKGIGYYVTSFPLDSFTAVNTGNIRLTDEVVLVPVINHQNSDEIYLIRLTPESSGEWNSPAFVIPQIDSNITRFELQRVGRNFVIVSQFAPIPGSEATAKLYYLMTDGELANDDSILPFSSINGDFQWDYSYVGGTVIFNDPAIGSYFASETQTTWQSVDSKYGTNFASISHFDTDKYQSPANIVQVASGNRLYWFTDAGNSQNGNIVISDGGDDMYDGGNYLYTDLSGNPIPYTHTSIETPYQDEVDLVHSFLMDGEVALNSEFFGEGSAYFTNLYPGLFVLAAYGPQIDSFRVDGNNGADSEGHTSDSVLQFQDTNYYVCYKTVYGATDPSINQIVIVKVSTDQLPIQNISTDTDDTYQLVSNLVQCGVEELHYLLYAKANGTYASEDEIMTLANNYIKTVAQAANGSADTCLSLMNQSYMEVIKDLPSHDIPCTVRVLQPNAEVIEFSTNFLTYERVTVTSDKIFVVLKRDNKYVLQLYSYGGELIQEVATGDTNSLDSNGFVTGNRFCFASFNIDPDTGNRGHITVHSLYDGTPNSKTFQTAGYTIDWVLNDWSWWQW